MPPVPRAASDRGGARTVEPARQELTREIRWIRRGRFGDDVGAWFSRFAPVLETREDDYLIAPAMPGLSVKIRGGVELRRQAAPGRGGGAGHPGRRRRPHRLVAQVLVPAVWGRGPAARCQRVGMAAGEEAPADLRLSGRGRRRQPDSPRRNGCSVELTEVQALGDAWWTLGFEARGRGALGGIKRAAAIVFDEPPPMTPAFRGRGSDVLCRVDQRARDGEGR